MHFNFTAFLLSWLEEVQTETQYPAALLLFYIIIIIIVKNILVEHLVTRCKIISRGKEWGFVYLCLILFLS